jgi:hypothetical protein
MKRFSSSDGGRRVVLVFGAGVLPLTLPLGRVGEGTERIRFSERGRRRVWLGLLYL